MPQLRLSQRRHVPHVRCTSPGRTSFYTESVDELIEWLEEADTDPMLLYMIEEFLRGRGDVQVAPLFEDESPVLAFLPVSLMS